MNLKWFPTYGKGKKYPQTERPVFAIRHINKEYYVLEVVQYESSLPDAEHYGWHQFVIPTPDVICWSEIEIPLILQDFLDKEPMYMWAILISDYYDLDMLSVVENALNIFEPS